MTHNPEIGIERKKGVGAVFVCVYVSRRCDAINFQCHFPPPNRTIQLVFFKSASKLVAGFLALTVSIATSGLCVIGIRIDPPVEHLVL